MKPSELVVIRLVNLVEELQEWIETHDGLFHIPVANFEYGAANGDSKVRIGDFVVWDSLDSDEDNTLPTFEKCRDEYLEFMTQFAGWNAKDEVTAQE